MIFSGDIMGHTPQINSAERAGGVYDFSEWFAPLKPLLQSADLAVTNLEAPLGVPPYQGYPQFSLPVEIAAALADAGFNTVFTANNHSCDKGYAGITRTIDALMENGLRWGGTYADAKTHDLYNPLTIDIDDWRGGILNYTYDTNQIPVPGEAVVNIIERDAIARDLEKARFLKAALPIVFFHWGIEYAVLPATQQKELADFCLQNGAQAVIGSHPHVLQPMELRQSADGSPQLVVYSLGNLISNQRNPGRDGGALVRTRFEKKDGRVQLAEADYILTWVLREFRGNRWFYEVLPAAEYEKKEEHFKVRADYDRIRRFCAESRTFLAKYNLGVAEMGAAAGSNNTAAVKGE